MGFLDKVKDVAGKAADQAKHGAAVGKEKLEDRKLQKRIEELHQEIGALIVAQRRGEAPADLDAQIDAKIAEIADCEREIEENDVVRPEGESGGEAVTVAPAAPAAEAPAAPPSAPAGAPPAAAPADAPPMAPPGPPQ